MRIVTVNVNGVRAALRKGMQEWLDAVEADVVCLQEVRAPDEVVDEAFAAGWNVVHDACEIKGRAGVAILSREPLGDVQAGAAALGEAAAVPAHTGRWIEATVPSVAGPVRVVSVYVHSGEAGTPKMDSKYEFLDLMTERMAALASAYDRVVVMGDINTAHTEHDIKNWKGNLKSAGFLPEERAYLDRWIAAGWVDVHRTLVGEKDGPYTWWSMRGKAFDTDTGWRIDYQYATPSLAAVAAHVRVDRAAAWDARWSDHAPLVVDYALAAG
ncbi:exodeoxyribonuclease III [Demequina sp. TTPB684]|uniref:exodeoxyribonuclease III n=1 Tax=unclassified Demequina TaxID=2620311 RepID=UPI001CF3C93C|nr:MULTISPECIES: exodeoxyribonuclease III [unclassified Demequina]MCB2412350.1 exodeoxyribonuclease III [Demequina sp. TTPB684]UPU88497.1 exodeoxyribonuclease III [Demequina sp. TMPB413]